MHHKIKLHLLQLLLAFVKTFPEGFGSRQKIYKYLHMKVLRKTDEVSWNVQRARQMGAKVGERCRFYSLNFFSEPYLVEIGDDVIISGNVVLITHDGAVYLFKDKIPDIRGHYGKIRIGSNCFIGMGAIILPNVSIGNNCIVGAGAVVMNSFPDNSVIAGNPAKVVFKTQIYEKLKITSNRTLTHSRFPFPLVIPPDEKKKMILARFNDLPLAHAREKKHS